MSIKIKIKNKYDGSNTSRKYFGVKKIKRKGYKTKNVVRIKRGNKRG